VVEEGVEVEVIMGPEEIIEEGEIQEVVEDLAVVVAVGEIIDQVAAAEVEVIEVNIEVVVEEEESIEDAGEEDHPAEVEEEVVIGKGKGHHTEEIDMKAGDHHHPRIAGTEITIGKKEEDLHQGMDHHQGMVHQEDLLLHQGTAMGHHAETMGDPPLQGPPDGHTRVADLVAADMRKVTLVGDLHRHPDQTDTEVGARSQAGILLHILVVLDQEKGILLARAILARAEALEEVEIIEEVAPVTPVEVTRIMTEETGGTAQVEEVMNPPRELLLAMIILPHQGVRGVVGLKKEERGVLPGTIARSFQLN